MKVIDPEVAITRRLRACSDESADLFVLVAADHRQNLLKQLQALGDDEARRQHLRILKRDFARDLGPASTGFLTDPEFGLESCLADSDVSPKLPLIVALEQTGYTGGEWDRLPSLVPGFDPGSAVREGANATKLLVYYHPDASNADEKEQLIRETAAASRAAGLPLFLEPLVYSPDPDKELRPGSSSFEDAVVETARRLSRLGASVMKVQFPGGPSEFASGWEAACRRLDTACAVPWVVLGAGVSFDEFADQVEVACRAGASGVLVGRTLWGETIHMSPADRAAFLTDTGVARVSALRELILTNGRPWSAASGDGGAQ